MSQQQSPDNVSIDEIPVDIANTQSGDVHASDVPEKIESLTRALTSTEPPTNPLVVLKAARWWYIHGEGGSDPAFQWAIKWARHLATDTPSDVGRFDEFLEYLVTIGSADDTAEFRERSSQFVHPPLRGAACPELSESPLVRFSDHPVHN